MRTAGASILLETVIRVLSSAIATALPFFVDALVRTCSHQRLDDRLKFIAGSH
jgi:hypothetical protein